MIGDNFSKDNIIGTNNFGHFVVIVVFLLLAILVAYKLSKQSEKFINFTFIGFAVFVVITEIIKMTVRFLKRPVFRYVFPMPFCFLFISAILLYLINEDKIRAFAQVFLSTGSLAGGIFYIFVPNGSIDTYPIYHVGALHGLLFHFLMVVTGLVLLFKKIYVPKLKDFKKYFSFMTFFSIIAIIHITFSDGNALFFGNGSGIAFLDDIHNISPFLHIAVVYIGESVLLYFVVYAIYVLICNIFNKIKQNFNLYLKN